MGEVVAFPRARTCFACANAGFTYSGVTICRDTLETIDSEVLAAQNCDDYELGNGDITMVDDAGRAL